VLVVGGWGLGVGCKVFLKPSMVLKTNVGGAEAGGAK